MPDTTIAANQIGSYEIALAANTVSNVTISFDYTSPTNLVQVLVHSGTAPVYAKYGAGVTLKDQSSTLIMPQMWSTMLANPNSNQVTVSLISSAAAVVSVYRVNDGVN